MIAYSYSSSSSPSPSSPAVVPFLASVLILALSADPSFHRSASAVVVVEAFSYPHPFAPRRALPTTTAPRSLVAPSSSSSSSPYRGGSVAASASASCDGGGEFDHILGSGWESLSPSPPSPSASASASRSRVGAVLRVPDGSPAVTLASASSLRYADGDDLDAYDDLDADGVDAAEGAEADAEGGGRAFSASDAATEDDPYVQEVLRKRQLREVRSSPFDPRSFLEGKDFTDVFFTVVVPVGLGLYGTKWAYDRGAERLSDAAEDGLVRYANEMIYHDGDLEEMRMCHNDYRRRLAWLGPKKKGRMIDAYLEAFAKKVTVGPQSISSLSYVFSLYKLTEDRAARILTDLCLSIPDKTASTGKLLFLGERILKSKDARERLRPIRDMLAGGYRDDVGISGEEILDKSQKAMGEAAYREAVTRAGKSQTTLTPGWEVLGLSRETARRVWDEEEENGFVSSKEAKYSRAKLKYDSKGRRLDLRAGGGSDDAADDAKGGDGDDDDDAEGGDDDGGGEEITSNAYECGECGYTLFVADGRETKFFGDSFVCPECGASKDKFVGRNIGEE